jgi:hypothetical protein
MSDWNNPHPQVQQDEQPSQETDAPSAAKKTPVLHKDRQHPDREEMRSRVDFAVHLLARRLYKSDMIRLMKRRFSITARTCERYLSHARKVRAAERAKRNGMTAEQLQERYRADSEDFWEAVIRGPDASLRDRMHAQEMLDWLRGLRPASEHHIKGSLSGDNGPPTLRITEVIVTTREEAKAILALEAEKNRLSSGKSQVPTGFAPHPTAHEQS